MGFGKKMHVVTVIQTILRSLLCFDTVKVASSCSVQVCVCLIVLPHVLHSWTKCVQNLADVCVWMQM